jgi:hypothetical protein
LSRCPQAEQIWELGKSRATRAKDRPRRVAFADLTTVVLVPNRALAETLRDRGESEVALTAVVTETEVVSVTGRFTARASDGGDIVLRARYGGGEPPAHVEITCEAAGVREEFRGDEYVGGEFQARCLGKVRTWNRTTGELALDPVAIFR